MPSADQPIRITRYRSASGWEWVDDRVIAETAVQLAVNGEPWLSFACTPTRLDALAVGFLFNEEVIESVKEIASVDVCAAGDQVDVWLEHLAQRPQFWQRTSGCSGGATAANQPQDEHPQSAPAPIPLDETGIFSPETLLLGMEQLLTAQDLYRETGGVHSSILFDGKTIRAQAEDIGRHNTLDKLAGIVLLESMTDRPPILLTTGRISSEMLQKSSRLGAKVVVSRTSPTSQSAALAQQLGITLVGYARRGGFLVYAHPERLDLKTPPPTPSAPPG